MKRIQYIIAGALLPVALGSCSDSFNASESLGEGRVILRASVNTEMQSRAVDADALSESCLVWISSEKGLVRQYEGLANVPAGGVWLVGGRYVAEAWAGDSVPASFDDRYFYGREDFTIASGSATQVDLVCKVRNVAVSVNYGEGVDGVLCDRVLTVGHSCGTLTWNDDNADATGYFMMNSRDNDLAVKLTGTKQTGEAYTLETVIENARPATHYTLNVKYMGQDEVEFGGAYFTIEIDETTTTEEDNIEIISAPQVVGGYQSLDQTVYGEVGNVSRQFMYVAAYTALKSVIVEAPGFDAYWGIGGDDVEILGCSDAVTSTLAAAGLVSYRIQDAEAGTDNVKIVFEEELLSRLADGEYSITVTATDTNGKKASGTMKIVISDALVATEPLAADAGTTWATEATIYGTVMKDDVENVGFRYRAVGASDWTYVDGEFDSRSRAIAKGTPFHAKLTGLTPGTTYEYASVSDEFVGSVATFATEAAAQLPNAGFEEWCMNGKEQKVSASASNFFWDSGNKAASGFGYNMTYPSDKYVHSGKYSACLESQKVVVAFAAGNLFVGEFIGTESGTKGVLGWGRPWSTRPKALKGYIKYTPAAINYTSSSLPDVKKGDMDQGQLYIALVDDSKMTYDGNSWPQIVRTADLANYSFNKSKANVIAFAETFYTEATPGDGMIEFELPLEYYRTDIKPSNIIVVASASRYGDYFVGGAGSTMYLDDLELVY